MSSSPYTAVDAVLAASEDITEECSSLNIDSRHTVIDLLSQQNSTSENKHETDQIFILGYN